MSGAGLELPSTRSLVSTFLRSVIGGERQVRAYYDEPEEHVVAVVEASRTPHPTLATFATASLHAVPNLMDGRDVRVELLMVGPVRMAEAANIVATSAFRVLKEGWLAAPGVVYPNAVREYVPDTTVPHVMWSEPIEFQGLSTISVDTLGHQVHVLQAVPLAEAERTFLVEHGFDALAARLASAEAEHFDFWRASIC